MRCIDTHCHYNLEPLLSGQPSHFRIQPSDPITTKNWQSHFATAQQHGVLAGVVVGADLENSQRALELHRLEPKLLASVGLHPDLIDQAAAQFITTAPHATHSELRTHLFDYVDQLSEELEKLVQPSELVAIGETGCDYYYFGDDQTLNAAVRAAQIRLFQQQLRLAQKFQLPVIIHTRDKSEQAYFDVLDQLTQTSFDLPFVLHCVSGPLTYIERALSMGAYLGFDGNLTYKNAQALQQILQTTPTDRIMVETDAPYLPPVPYRGQICEPWMVTKVVEFVCNARNISQDQLVTNTAHFFGPAIENLIADQTS